MCRDIYYVHPCGHYKEQRFPCAAVKEYLDNHEDDDNRSRPDCCPVEEELVRVARTCPLGCRRPSRIGPLPTPPTQAEAASAITVDEVDPSAQQGPAPARPRIILPALPDINLRTRQEPLETGTLLALMDLPPSPSNFLPLFPRVTLPPIRVVFPEITFPNSPPFLSFHPRSVYTLRSQHRSTDQHGNSRG